MIGKQIKGTSFRGLLNYLQGKEGSRLIGGNMAGKNPRTLAAEFGLARQLNANLQKAVYHASLSLPQTESLEDEKWKAIAADYLRGMEFEGSQYVVYRHGDREHDHIHIVASRIRVSDGSTVSDSWDYRRSEKLIRELEQKYQLTPTPSSFESLRRGKTTGEVRQLRRTGKKSVKVKLQGLLDGATAASVTVPELIGRLQEGGIEVRVSYNRTGKVKGISYQLEGMAFSGTHLGKAYTFPGLQKYKNVDYQPSQDELIRLACARPLTQKTFSAGKQMEDNHLKLLYRQKYEQIKRRLKQELNWENPRELDRAIAVEAFKETKDDYEVKATLSQSDVLRELKPEMSEEQYQEALWEYVQQLSREAEQRHDKEREGQEIER